MLRDLENSPLDDKHKALFRFVAKVNHDSDRDFYLNAEEAIAYGLADKIVDKL